jgi:putative holliday junction resolvase
LRALGLDLGSRRIGVALSDPSGTIASPHSVIERSGDVTADEQAIAALVIETEAELVVVGLPVSMSGGMGPAAKAAAAEAQALATVLPVPVETFDERLTTVAADRLLLAGRVRGGARRRVVDKIAAAVMLQGWLERRS